VDSIQIPSHKETKIVQNVDEIENFSRREARSSGIGGTCPPSCSVIM
jgi:hypothetical protein